MWELVFLAVLLLPLAGVALRALGAVALALGAALLLAERVAASRQGAGADRVRITAPRLPHALRAASDTRTQEGEPAAAASELDNLARLVVRDFVHKWHSGLVEGVPDGDAFPNRIERTLVALLQNMQRRICTMDAAGLLVRKIVPLLKEHHDAYVRALAQSPQSGRHDALLQTFEERELFLAARYNNGALHAAISAVSSTQTKGSEQEHLRHVAHRLLALCLPPDQRISRVMNTLLREVLACAVLQPAVEMLTDPVFLYQHISSRADAALEQHASVGKLREVLEIQENTGGAAEAPMASSPAPRRRSSRRRSGRPSDRLRPALGVNDVASYERLLRRIASTSSLIDVRRMRSEVVLEIQRTKAFLGVDHAAQEDAESAARLYASLPRLDEALALIDRRIEHLQGKREAPDPQARRAAQPPIRDVTETTRRISLGDVLTHASCLSFFLEFMERRQRAALVRFWLLVESLKSPLEQPDMEYEELAELATIPEAEASPEADVASPRLGGEPHALQDTLCVLLDDFYPLFLLELRPKYVQLARAFVHGPPAAQANEWNRRMVRQSVLLAQRDVAQLMAEHDWDAFRASNLFLQAAEHLPAAGERRPPGAHSSVARVFSPYTGMDADTSGASGTAPAESPEMPRSSSLFGMEEQSSLFGQQTDGGLDASTSSGGSLEVEEEGASADAVEAIQHALQNIIAGAHPSTPDERPAPRRSLARSSTPMGGTAPNEQDENAPPPSSQTSPRKLRAARSEQQRLRQARLEELYATTNKYRAHGELLDHMVQKAELRGASASERMLLAASRRAVRRDMRNLACEIQYLEQRPRQLGERQLTVCTTAIEAIDIVHAQFHSASDGRFVLYHIHVCEQATQGASAREWVVCRRYSEFYALHQALKQYHRQVNMLEPVFPGKRLVGHSSASFIDARRRALERYLRELVRIPAVLSSADLRLFLSPSTEAYHAHALDEARDANGAAAPLWRTLSGMPELADDLGAIVGGLRPAMFDMVIQQMLLGDTAKSRLEANPSGFAVSICDLVLGVFDLKHSADWLRRRAIETVLQTILGGTIERFVTDAQGCSTDRAGGSTTPWRPCLPRRRSTGASLGCTRRSGPPASRSSCAPGPSTAKRSGAPPASGPTRRSRLCFQVCSHARRGKLTKAMAESLLGRERARTGARKVVLLLQNQRLSKHLIYTVLDMVRELSHNAAC